MCFVIRIHGDDGARSRGAQGRKRYQPKNAHSHQGGTFARFKAAFSLAAQRAVHTLCMARILTMRGRKGYFVLP